MADGSRFLVLLLVSTLVSLLEGRVASAVSGSSFVLDILPGAAPISSELKQRLDRKWNGRPPGYEPRTRHLNTDGSPKYTNRLFLSSSPYLLQHAHNPVNWYPWGDEAFATAKQLGRPVLLSIGYSTCHWCHVMEEESFEDEEIARFLNENYVAIKVDREERPDVDALYMDAVQALIGSGGWPLNVWLTPERHPFYGGTYYPPRGGERGARSGFLTVLSKIKQVYVQRPEEVTKSAAALVEQVRQRLVPEPPDTDLPGTAVLDAAARQYADSFDATNGGLLGRHKFPSSLPIPFLLRYHRQRGLQQYLDMAIRTLEAMAAGGIYDQVGGGFHRYATDEGWLVPHFEKMLYGNALLIVAYLEAFQATRRDDFARIAQETLRYVERDMTSVDGAFFSATDADSLNPRGEREEGRFFTWADAELVSVLGAEKAHLIATYYGVLPVGSFEGRNILHIPRSLEALANELNVSPPQLRASIDDSRELLYRNRAQRPAPLRDEKILSSWNGLMISAFARATLVLADDHYAQAASRAAEFVWKNLRHDGELRRSFKDGESQQRGYLDDYAFMIAGLLDLYEATSAAVWFDRAVELDDVLGQHYEDRNQGGFYRVGDGHEKLLAREKPADDGAEPSGNSVQCLNLIRLYELTGNDRYRQRSDRLLRSVGSELRRRPVSLSAMLLALDFRLVPPKEIVIVTPNRRAEAEPFLKHLREMFLPNRVLVVVSPAAITAQSKRIPLLAGKLVRNDKATAYVCENRVCSRPTTDPGLFATQIAARHPLAP